MSSWRVSMAGAKLRWVAPFRFWGAPRNKNATSSKKLLGGGHRYQVAGHRYGGPYGRWRFLQKGSFHVMSLRA